jgi:hypothetical protein
LGYPTMWYRSKELTGSGGCSGGSLQRVNPDETRTLLGVVISNSSTNGLGIRALDASGIFLVKIMSII